MLTFLKYLGIILLSALGTLILVGMTFPPIGALMLLALASMVGIK